MNSILLEADELVSHTRQDDYGHPREDFARIAKMWSSIFGIDIPLWKVPLAMICVKISRECNKHKRDNARDIAGYAKTLQMCREDEKLAEVE